MKITCPHRAMKCWFGLVKRNICNVCTRELWSSLVQVMTCRVFGELWKITELLRGRLWCRSPRKWWKYIFPVMLFAMMTSSNGTFPRYWPFVRGVHRSPVNSPHKGQWCGALSFFYLRLDKRLSKQLLGRWFKTPSGSLWRNCNTVVTIILTCVYVDPSLDM